MWVGSPGQPACLTAMQPDDRSNEGNRGREKGDGLCVFNVILEYDFCKFPLRVYRRKSFALSFKLNCPKSPLNVNEKKVRSFFFSVQGPSSTTLPG